MSQLHGSTRSSATYEKDRHRSTLRERAGREDKDVWNRGATTTAAKEKFPVGIKLRRGAHV